MQNDPTGTSGRHSAYYAAMREADDDLADALSAIRAEEDAHRITPAKAAVERISLLERHIELCRRLRREHLGGS
jgi:hypothetical protein